MFLYLPCVCITETDAPEMFMSWFFDKDIAQRILTAKEKADDFSPFLVDVRLNADKFCLDTLPSQCVYNTDTHMLYTPSDTAITYFPPFALSREPMWQDVDYMFIRFDHDCVDFEFKVSNLGLGESVKYLSEEVPYYFFENLISGTPPTIATDHNWREDEER